MSKSHDVPEWRKGAFYWRPLMDGREITIYPLLFGAARLCIGPLADEFGYDMAFRYDSHQKAIEAADTWNPETDNTPSGFTVIETKKDDEDEAPKINDYVKVVPDDGYSINKQEHGPNMVNVTRTGKRGTILFEGVEHRDVNNDLIVEVTTVSFVRYDGRDGAPQGQSTIHEVNEDDVKQMIDPKTVWPHPDNNDPFGHDH